MTNHELRHLAHQALRREPLRLIGLTALMAAPFFAAALWVALVLGLMLWNDLYVLYTDAAGAVRFGITHGLTYGQLIPYITGMSGGVFFVGIVSQGLLTGYVHCLLSSVRGEKPTVRMLLGRLDTCLKMLGLEVMVALKALLRMVPLMLTGMLIARLDPGGRSGLSQLAMVIAPLAAMIWLARMLLSHALVGCVFADAPEIRIRDAIARSRAAMKGQMWRYFGLHAPYWLAAGVVTSAASALIEMIPAAETVVSLAMAAVCALLALLGNLAGAAFYAQRCRPEEAAEEATEAVLLEEEKTAAGEAIPAEENE